MRLSHEAPGSAARRFCTDACLARCLRARGWDVARAAKLLRATLAWREAFGVEALTWADVAQEGATGKTYRLRARDRRGRPVLCLAPGRENSRDHVGQIRHLVYAMETAVRAMAAGRAGPPRGAGADLAPEQLTLFVDFSNWSLRSAPGRKATVETIHILQEHYFERLGSAVVFNPPRVFAAFWAMVRPFLDARTAAKVTFLDARDPLRARDVLASVFEDLSLLERSLGGDSPDEFDAHDYGARMRAEDEAQARANAAEVAAAQGTAAKHRARRGA